MELAQILCSSEIPFTWHLAIFANYYRAQQGAPLLSLTPANICQHGTYFPSTSPCIQVHTCQRSYVTIMGDSAGSCHLLQRFIDNLIDQFPFALGSSFRTGFDKRSTLFRLIVT